jgi:hypothetical protein
MTTFLKNPRAKAEDAAKTRRKRRLPRAAEHDNSRKFRRFQSADPDLMAWCGFIAGRLQPGAQVCFFGRHLTVCSEYDSFQKAPC